MNIHSGPFSEIDFDPENSLLSVSWTTDSAGLDEKAVKFEISRILDYVKAYSIKNVIVDTRNYVFTDNAGIQDWINHTYMPSIIANGVMKYALVVNADIKDNYEDFEEGEAELPLIEYFKDVKKAKAWIEF